MTLKGVVLEIVEVKDDERDGGVRREDDEEIDLCKTI